MADATHIVKKGDTLWYIANKYLDTYGKPNGYNSVSSYVDHLALINNIANKNLIYVGQKLKLSGTASSSSTSSTATRVTIQHFGLQADTDNTLFVMWAYSRANTENYQVQWQYKAGGKWFDGSDSTTTSKQSTYSYPANAEYVRTRVKPISKKYTKNNKEYSYYTGQWSSYKEYNVGLNVAIPIPNVPTIEIEKYQKHGDFKANSTGTVWSSTTTVTAYKLLASIKDYSWGNVTTEKGQKKRICFELYKTDSAGRKRVATEYSNVGTLYSLSSLDIGEAKVTFRDLDTDADYQVHCRAEIYKSSTGKVLRYSEWTNLSDNARTAGDTPKSLKCTDVKSTDENVFDVYLEWEGLEDDDGTITYDIEYTTNPDYFDSTTSPQSQSSGIPNCIIVGLNGGETYYFRVRSVNESGTSGWSLPIYVTLGEKPTAPTTWSLTNTIILGEETTLYWTHNSIDGSKQKYAEIELTHNGKTETIKLDPPSDGTDPTTYYVLKTINDDGTERYPDGASINWRVRTAGILTAKNDNGVYEPVYSDYSILRTIEVRVKPTLIVNVSNADSIDIEEINEFPFFVSANVSQGKNNQTPIMYYLSVFANESYDTVDAAGNNKTIREGEVIFSKHFDTTSPEFYETDENGNTTWKPYEFSAVISAENIDLENSISYTVNCMVTMDSGLTGSGSAEIVVAWDELYYEPDAEVVINDDIYAAHIRPYCGRKPYYKVDYSLDGELGYVYINSGTLIPPLEGEALEKDTIVSSTSVSLSDSDIEPLKDGLVYTITTSDGITWINIDADQNPHITDDMDKILLINLSGHYEVSFIPASKGVYINDELYSSKWEGNGMSYTGFIDGGIYINGVGSYGFEYIDQQIIKTETVYTTDNKMVYVGETDEGKVRFCIGDNLVLDDDVLLSVYRRDFDGAFTELAVDLENTGLSYITDPHPALNYARYRIVAKSKTTGSVSYTDISDIPIGGNAIIIQWDEDWNDYEMDNYNESTTSAWSGTMLKLPYNIDVSDSYNTDVSLVNYIGRKRPVSYYGTHLDEKSSWSTEIPSYDHVTLNLLRRLAIYTGDVYVREPSGSGYWANVKVSFSQTHCEVTIPVTFDITRVEGGV